MTASNMISVIVAIFFVVSIGLGDTPLLYYAATSSDSKMANAHRPPSLLRPVRSGPFEPFTLVHVGSYAADIQHSGEAIADHLKSSFAIICFNSRTYESGGVMAVVKAHAAAEHLLRDYEFGQSEQARHNGWRYFLEETDLVPGMNPDEATKLRQARLERRESGFLNNPCSR